MPGRDSLEFVAAMALGGVLGAGMILLLRSELLPGARWAALETGRRAATRRRRRWARRLPGADGAGR